MKLIHLLKALRPYQWTKNLIIFAALVFSKHLLDPEFLILSIKGFFIFSFLSGSVYLLNDVADYEKDRLHPKKQNRAVASGKISRIEAVIASVIISALSIWGGFHLNRYFGLSALTYFTLVFLYSLFLKKIVILDVIILALGFVVRAVAGGLLINVEISDWLLIVTIFLALFLGFSKRRGELVKLNDKAKESRSTLSLYTIPILDQFITITTTATIMSYTLYTLAEQTMRKFGNHLWLTTPVVVYIVFRYFYLVYAKEMGSDPSKTLLQDMPLLIGVFIWAALVFLLIYKPGFIF
ncbi:MAG: decaprenyl-phosphate phosphoribosyltransferase [Acidobacteria bacterium]|nr:decaprenyl-phosphate phosphoribosyltransferase [Acidobacteriota bacterium]